MQVDRAAIESLDYRGEAQIVSGYNADRPACGELMGPPRAMPRLRSEADICKV
jgi:hypothetical protein